MVSEVKVQMLLKLIESGKVTVDSIKAEEYRDEVQRRLELPTE
ncbi:hypothetical protein [Brevibacillus borstelensis]